MTSTVKLSSLRADSARDRDGDWIDAPLIPGVSLLVRSIHYPPFTIARDLLQQKFRRQFGNKPVPQDTWAAEHGRLYGQHLLLGWKGFDVEFSPEVAADTLGDPGFRELIASVEMAAVQVGQAHIEFIEDAAKNSAAPSATT